MFFLLKLPDYMLLYLSTPVVSDYHSYDTICATAGSIEQLFLFTTTHIKPRSGPTQIGINIVIIWVIFWHHTRSTGHCFTGL